MRVDELARGDVLPLDVLLELCGLDAPLAAATDLDGRQLGAADERIDLSDGGVEHLGNVRKGEESGPGHGSTLPLQNAVLSHRLTRPCG